MAGFLDPKERVIDLVLTDVGKSLLLKGDLHFTYWIPFDDEVDYDPPIAPNSPIPFEGGFVTSASLDPEDMKSLRIGKTEEPLLREATMGYRGLNVREEDTTNVHRPMYSAPPGVGQTYPLLTAVAMIGTGSISGTEERFSGSLEVLVSQQKNSRLYVQYDSAGQNIVNSVGPTDVTFTRSATNQPLIIADYPAQINQLENMHLEGFLVTVFHSSTLVTSSLSSTLGQVLQGGFEEVLQNRDSKGNVVYRNDLTLDNLTP